MYTEGSLFDGRYLLKERKGRGSFGEVWLAEDTEIGVDFAIKIYVAMDTKGLDEFRKEYQLSCNLINSNLLHINKMEVCKEDGCPYLVMPYCPRGASSLTGAISEQEMWHFLHDVANGLAYLHAQTPPIIHQDIKPDNILQMQSGDFVITDFGISKQLRGTRRSTGGDSSGAVAYMGPERFQVGYTSIKSSDIWSLGATLYEMGTGLLPFEGKGGKLQEAGFAIPVLTPQFSQDLSDIMQSCMHPEPWSRPSARQLADYAAEKMKGLTPSKLTSASPTASSTPAGVSQKSQTDDAGQQSAVMSKLNSNTTLIAVCVVALCAVVGVFAYLFMGKNTKQGDATDVVAEQPVVAETYTAVEETEPEPVTEVVEPEEVVEAEAPAAPAAESAKTESVPQKKTTDAPKKETKPAATTTSSASSAASSGSLSLSYGKYTGAVKGGYPNGKGKLVYTTSRQINKYDSKGRTAEAGDYVEGLFVNGFFTTGKHYNSSGELIENISVGVVDGVYESK